MQNPGRRAADGAKPKGRGGDGTGCGLDRNFECATASVKIMQMAALSGFSKV